MTALDPQVYGYTYYGYTYYGYTYYGLVTALYPQVTKGQGVHDYIYMGYAHHGYTHHGYTLTLTRSPRAKAAHF